MAAGVEEGVNEALPVTHEEDGFLAHASIEEIARLGDLALMADEQPGAGEDAL